MTTPAEDHPASELTPFQAFVRDETASSACLFVAAILAMIAANSQFAEQYHAWTHLPITLAVGNFLIEKSVQHLINDGLMALFFLVLGLEIKRELLVGDLRDSQRAIPVLGAALGGMVVPALIYVFFNASEPSAHGWGIPMATDSAFALGVLMLLGTRGPNALKAFLVAYAIIDDLGAILVIALFYTESLNFIWLGVGAICMAAMLVCSTLGVRHFLPYLGIGILLWVSLLGAGVHGTVAGVLIALAIPARPQRGRKWFVRRTQRLISDIKELHPSKEEQERILANPQQHAAVEAVEEAAKMATTPLKRWERSLELPVLWLVLPLFAFANAGIPLNAEMFAEAKTSPIVWGIMGGLVFGKAAGISLFTWVAVRAGWGKLPEDLTMSHVVGLSLLGGMGFTMSIFIAGLTFGPDSGLYLAKTAIVAASLIAGLGGYLWLRFGPRTGQPAS